MYWVHEDGVTKSKRTTDVYGNVASTVELDPWGANTARSSATVFQPQNFTSYTRDLNGDQDAMARRYSPTGRFSQPDPYSGSYDFSDPQSLNRYAYVGNDPVNRKDPSGTMPISGGLCYVDGMPVNCSTAYMFVNSNAGYLTTAWGINLLPPGTFRNARGELVANDRIIDPNDHVGPISSAFDSFTDAIGKAFDRVNTILGGSSKCAQFFGPDAQAALAAMRKVFSIASAGGPGGVATGISQSYAGGVNAIPAGTYRTPATFIVYRNGPFFMQGKGTIGGYQPGTEQAQTLAILHELAHNIKNAAGNGFLIPNDGPGTKPEDLSQKNTRQIMNVCGKEVFNGK